MSDKFLFEFVFCNISQVVMRCSAARRFLHRNAFNQYGYGRLLGTSNQRPRVVTNHQQHAFPYHNVRAFSSSDDDRHAAPWDDSGFFSDCDEDEEMVEISKERYQSLINSDIIHWALLKQQPVSVNDVLEHTSVETLFRFLYKELPIRYAHRVKMIETLPNWHTIPDLVQLHAMNRESFWILRNAEDNPAGYRDVLLQTKKRHSRTERLIRAFRILKQRHFITDARADEFLDNFFIGRISSDLLMSHYLLLSDDNLATEEGRIGAISTAWEPEAIVRSTADRVQKICRRQFKKTPEIFVDSYRTNPIASFPCIPQFLRFIVQELVKNSARATVDYAERKGTQMSPINIVISGDEDFVAIRISDKAGGIPLHLVPKVKSYLYTSASVFFPPLPTTGTGSGDGLHAPFFAGMIPDDPKLKYRTH